METLVFVLTIGYLASSCLLFFLCYRLNKIEERLYIASCAVVGDLNA